MNTISKKVKYYVSFQYKNSEKAAFGCGIVEVVSIEGRKIKLTLHDLSVPATTRIGGMALGMIKVLDRIKNYPKQGFLVEVFCDNKEAISLYTKKVFEWEKLGWTLEKGGELTEREELKNLAKELHAFEKEEITIEYENPPTRNMLVAQACATAAWEKARKAGGK